MTIYHIKTSIHALMMRQRAIGASTSHLSQTLSDAVIFQILAAEPENEVGADTITFSDFNRVPILSPILIFHLILQILSNNYQSGRRHHFV